MKKTVVVMLVLMLLNLCVPAARAEISRDLDPMVPVDFQTIATEGTPASNTTTGQASNAVSAVDTVKEKKRAGKTKKKKTKKSPEKKSSSHKNSKSSSKKSEGSKTSKNGPR